MCDKKFFVRLPIISPLQFEVAKVGARTHKCHFSVDVIQIVSQSSVQLKTQLIITYSRARTHQSVKLNTQNNLQQTCGRHHFTASQSFSSFSRSHSAHQQQASYVLFCQVFLLLLLSCFPSNIQPGSDFRLISSILLLFFFSCFQFSTILTICNSNYNQLRLI